MDWGPTKAREREIAKKIFFFPDTLHKRKSDEKYFVLSISRIVDELHYDTYEYDLAGKFDGYRGEHIDEVITPYTDGVTNPSVGSKPPTVCPGCEYIREIDHGTRIIKPSK